MRLTPFSSAVRRGRTDRGLALAGEWFENRRVLSAVWAAFPESEPNNTLDISEDLGTLLADLSVGRSGAIGEGADETADVDWFQFHLEQPSDVVLAVRNPQDGESVHVGLSLFNTSPFTGEDIQTLLGYRLLAQAAGDSSSDVVQLEQALSPGTYFVAVSGANNLAFFPFLEGSGYAGPGSEYDLDIAATSLGLSDTDGPMVLSADPAIESVQSDSPLVVRVQFSHELDPYSIVMDDTVRFIYSPNADFTDGDEMSVPLLMQSFSSAASELQLMPFSALKAGYYQIHLSGSWDTSASVLMDFMGQPLGSNADFPNGRDFDFTFQINGSEGTEGDSALADDTPDGAHELGELTDVGVVQVAGTIGDDPYFDPFVDWLLSPANDVDLYHFQVQGEGSFSLAAEVFAGRIGSPLDPGVSLYQRLEDGSLQFVAGNNNTLNPVTATNWFSPIFTDAALFAGLTEGDYFVAVSSGQNTPAPAEGQAIDAEGLFNPVIAHSGLYGSNTGRYVLNLRVTADNVAPEVVLITPEAGSLLSEAPTHLTVQFSESMSLQELAFRAFEQPEFGTVSAAFIRSADGTEFYPRLESYDATNCAASFVLLDGLPSGHYEWHLSGARGLTDLAGLPLVGNADDGDFVVGFDVESSPRGREGDPLNYLAIEPNDDLETPQDLGVIFPHEWQSGITISREASEANADSVTDQADVYRFEVLLKHDYFFSVTGDSLPASMRLTLRDADGQLINAAVSGMGKTLKSTLQPGVYFLQVGTWPSESAASMAYQIRWAQLDLGDNPPPLTGGPAPALQLRLIGTAPLPSTPNEVTLNDTGSELSNPFIDLGNISQSNSGNSATNIVLNTVTTSTSVENNTSTSANNTTSVTNISTTTSSNTSNSNIVLADFVGPTGGSQGTSSATVNTVVVSQPDRTSRPISVPETALPMLGQWLVGGTGNASMIWASAQRDAQTVLLFPSEQESSSFQGIAYLFFSDRKPRSQPSADDESSDPTLKATEPTSRVSEELSPTQDPPVSSESPAASEESSENSSPPKAAANRAADAEGNTESGSSTSSRKAARSSVPNGSPANSSTSSVELFWITGISAVLFGFPEPNELSAAPARRTWSALRAKWGRRLAP